MNVARTCCVQQPGRYLSKVCFCYALWTMSKPRQASFREHKRRVGSIMPRIRNREVFLTAHHLYLKNKTVELEWLMLPHGSQCVGASHCFLCSPRASAKRRSCLATAQSEVTEETGDRGGRVQNRWCLKVSSCSNAMQHTSNRAFFLDCKTSF